MTTRRSTTLVAGIAVAVLLLAGCGDDGGDEGGDGGRGRPTADEILAVLPTDDLDAQGRECLAQAFIDSDVSDAGLQAIVDAGGLARARGVSQADQDAVQTALGEGIRCSVADELPSATATTSADGSTSVPGEGPGPGGTTTSTETTTTAAG